MPTTFHRSALSLAACLATTLASNNALAAGTSWNTLGGAAPLVIGHRGAAGYRPEHTLASYDLAITLGANVIEPALVMTKDGILVARHEPDITATTDVSSRAEFAARKTTRSLDGVATTGWFVEDFNLAELKTLRAVQTRGRTVDLTKNTTPYDSAFQVPTLDEVIALAKARSATLGRTIAVYPEVKHSTYMQQVSLAAGRPATYFEDTLVSTLHTAYGNSVNAPVFIQSFEVGNLQYLNTQTDIKLVQLVDADDVNADGSLSLVDPFRQPFDQKNRGRTLSFADLVSDVGLRMVATYADGIGPWKPYLVKTVADGVDRNGDGKLTTNDRRVDGSTGVIESAHAAGLFVHTWTFRNDASGYGFTDPQAEMAYYMRLGVDGVFTDFADTGVAALAAAAVPEPQTWALMLGGVVLLGAMRRRSD